MPRSYLYTSDQGNDGNGTPYGGRVPRGRSPAIRTPYTNYRESTGPDGTTDTATLNNVPYQAPSPDDDLPSPTRMRMQNEGLIPRGQSSPTPSIMSGSPTTPMPFAGSNMGTLGGYGAASSPGTGSASPMPGTTPTQPPQKTTLSKPEAQQLKAYRDRLKAEFKDMPEPGYFASADDKKKYNDKQAEIAKYDDLLAPKPAFLDPQPAAPAQPMAGAQTAIAAPAPFYNPQTGAPQMREPITDKNRIDVNDSQYQANRRENLQQAYATAGADLQANPNLGTTPIPAVPHAPLSVPPGGMGNSPADYRQASGQAGRNQAAIQRGNEAANTAAVDKNFGQIQQNQGAQVAINDRLQQFRGGDYSMTQPAGANQRGTQYPPSPAFSNAGGTTAPPAQAATPQTAGGFNPTTPQGTPQQMQGVTPATQPAQQAAAPTSQPAKLSDQQIAAYLQLAGGDVNKAKELARAHGHSVQ